jgi:hypothetical protein
MKLDRHGYEDQPTRRGAVGKVPLGDFLSGPVVGSRDLGCEEISRSGDGRDHNRGPTVVTRDGDGLPAAQ